MSFALTTSQVRDGTKDVTRRLGWKNLKPGEHVMACVKCQGLGKGGKVEKIREIVCVSNKPEELGILFKHDDYALSEVKREGFPNLTPTQFVVMFCSEMECVPDREVNRIEFKYVP